MVLWLTHATHHPIMHLCYYVACHHGTTSPALLTWRCMILLTKRHTSPDHSPLSSASASNSSRPHADQTANQHLRSTASRKTSTPRSSSPVALCPKIRNTTKKCKLYPSGNPSLGISPTRSMIASNYSAVISFDSCGSSAPRLLTFYHSKCEPYQTSPSAPMSLW